MIILLAAADTSATASVVATLIFIAGVKSETEASNIDNAAMIPHRRKRFFVIKSIAFASYFYYSTDAVHSVLDRFIILKPE